MFQKKISVSLKTQVSLTFLVLTLFPRFSNSSILRCRFSASNLRIKHKKLVEFWWIRQTEISHNDELKMVRLKPRRKFLVVAPDIHVKSYLPRARYLPPPKFCVSIVFNFKHEKRKFLSLSSHIMFCLLYKHQ